MRKGDDLTTFIAPKVEKIRNLILPDPQGPAQACSGNSLPFTLPVMNTSFSHTLLIVKCFFFRTLPIMEERVFHALPGLEPEKCICTQPVAKAEEFFTHCVELSEQC